MIEIEHNVPVEKTNYRKSKYPYTEMEVGDSFVVPLINRSGAVSSCLGWGQRQSPIRKFTSRLINETTVRVWRVL